MADANATRALLKARYWHSDEYVGTAEQLCACGLVQPGQFPGQPGRGKVRATYFLSDGQPAPPGSHCMELTYSVQRVSSTRFSVSVSLSDQEVQRRKAVPYDKGGRLPLDLPETPALEAPAAPAWTPAGFVFRRQRESDFVFEVSIEHLRQSGVMEAQPLPSVDAERMKSFRFCSSRFGWVWVVQRTALTVFVTLRSPSEIRNADYQVDDFGWSVHHKGTKQQLQARGLGVGIGFPGEPHCNARKVTALAPESGGEARIELLHPSDWCGNVPRFEVSVRRSEAEQETLKKAKREADAEKARIERLKTMPATPDKFREEVAQTFWSLANITRVQMQAKDGYRFTTEVVDEFTDAVTDAYWAIKNGATAGASPRQKYQQVMSANAKANKPLQRFLSSIQADDSH